MNVNYRGMSDKALLDEVYDGMDARASTSSYNALQELVRRKEHAERKWHQYHVYPIFGLTCPYCIRGREEEQ